MDKLEIRKKLISMVTDKFHVSIKENMSDEYFFGEKIGMPPRILVYIYFFIQEEFDIKIDAKYILNNKFCTINNIVDSIYEMKDLKESILLQK